MKKTKMYILISMIVLSAIFGIGLFVSLKVEFDLVTYLFLHYGSLVLLVIDLIAIVSYVIIFIVSKSKTALQIMKYTSIATVGILIVIVVIVIALNPLLRSEARIKKNILKITPIGISIERVFNVIEEKKWKIDGLEDDELGMPIPQYIKDDAIENKEIELCIGEYRILLDTGVVVCWSFDDDLKLIDIVVEKDYDSI